MKKKLSILSLLGAVAVLIVGAILLSSCEGPMGPAGPAGQDGVDGINGTDGTDGVDGNVTCLACHNTDTKEAIASEFAASQHASGSVAVAYAGGRASCARCHSHEGYLEFARTGDVANDFTNPSPWECSTCHAIHTDFAAGDYAFRLGDPVTLVADETIEIDGGNNNTCINCHQARRTAASYDSETADTTYTRKFTGDDIAVYSNAAVGPAGSITLDQSGTEDTLVVVFDVPVATHAYISSTHAGPHHGPQANVWSGKAAGVVDGDAFAPHAPGCVACHMGPESGHTWHPESATCIACHASETDHFDDLEDNEDRLVAIAEALEALHAVHIDAAWEEGDDLWGMVHPLYASLERDIFNAWWDFILLVEDRSNGAHNPTYIDALIDGIEATLGL